MIDRGGEVTLFTRPRRFGKTLALNMVKTFFEKKIGFHGEVLSSEHYFKGLNIIRDEKYREQMGKYPVIFLTFKSAKQPNFEVVYECLKREITKEFERHRYVLTSDTMLASNKEQYCNIMNRTADYTEYATSLKSPVRMPGKIP